MNYEPITLMPNWADRARDTYWRNPTLAQVAGMFLTGAAIVAAAVAVI